MQKRLSISLFLLTLVFGGLAFAGQSSSASKFAGTWNGSWSGGSSGKFEMTVTSEGTGNLSVKMVATPDSGETTTFQSKSADVVESKLKVKFEDPDGNVEIALEGAFEGADLKGTYAIRDKAQGNEVESGAWTASKK